MQKFTKQFILNFYPYLIFFIIIGVLSLIFYKKLVGKAGEHHVKQELKKLPKEKYKIINDVMIKSSYSTHQIDHVVVSKFGIFVIETKQYNGYIVGNEYDKKWKQNNKYYINNPIHQNYGHIKALEEVLNIPLNNFIPIVCIPSTARFKINSKSHVVHIYELLDTITSYEKEILNNYDDIYNKVNEMNIIDKNERKKHIKYAKEIKINKDYNSENSCPKCGGNLVKRNGKYGEFVGCSNYPKCKFIKK